MFNDMDGVMRAWAIKKTQWKEDLYFAVKFAWQKLSKYYCEVTSTTGWLLISAHIYDPVWEVRSFKKLDKGIDINPEDEASYTTQDLVEYLKYVENKYCTKHWHLPVTTPERVPNNNFVSSAMASRYGQSCYDPYDLSSDDEDYLMPNNVTETTPRWSDHAACLLPAANLYVNSPSELPQNWGQINQNLNDYHSDPMEIRSTFWLPHITNWWHQQKELHSKYADLSNVARNIFSIIPHAVGMEATCSFGQDVIGWRQSKTTRETLRVMVILMQFGPANNGFLAGYHPALHTTSSENNIQINREAERRKSPRIAKVHNFFEILQGSQNLCATQKESHAQNKQITAIGYISDTEEIVKASWSNFQHDGAAAFKLSERSPLPPALSAKDLPGGQTEILNVSQIKQIDSHPVECDDDSSPEGISDTENWLN